MAESMPPMSVNGHQAHRSLDVCGVCGINIRTMCWRGTGACGDTHFKALHGHASVSRVQSARAREF